MKCIVRACPNYSEDGTFQGPICSPCADAVQGYFSPVSVRRIVTSMLVTKDEAILQEVYEERRRQDTKFDSNRDQSILEWSAILHEEELEAAREVVDGHFAANPVEAAMHRSALRKELIQTAAVCVATVGGIDGGAK